MWLGTPFPIDITNLNSTGGDDPQYPELELGYSAIKNVDFFLPWLVVYNLYYAGKKTIFPKNDVDMEQFLSFFRQISN